MTIYNDKAGIRAGAATVDAFGRVCQATPVFQELMGVSVGADMLHADIAERFPASLHQAVAAGGEWHGALTGADGIPLLARFHPMPMGQSGVGVLVVEDLGLAQGQQSALLRFARGVTHEFNNTLASIQGFAEIAASFDVQGAPMVGRALQNILRGCEQAGEAILMARIMAGRIDCKFEVVDIGSVVGEWCRRRSSLLPFAVQLKFQAEPENVMLSVDVSLLETAFDALWDNALRALDGEGTLLVRIGSSERQGGHVVLDVQDSGAGMEPDVLAVCAEPYFTTREAEGAKGRGLALARGIIWAHGGRFFVTSEKGAGTTVRILLPEGQR
ncbi:HAMP domain-containing histidine kinase [Desulfovibrio mangrovi]|uniref:sensor histidine kinase n=1 Tax=Desulfovibrio mangrovi TaxID=2976983 RepID=UPI0022459ECE|nr:HAMP domain-containing sensor histidine kinase [Desulfovibrio mangrovi]UZP65878.1 HAMP domain-containing histidine kinase [Desulfovibrio mangrovi]